MNIADSSPKTIVVFNLDGTLSRHDIFRAYLLSFLVRHPRRIYRLAHLRILGAGIKICMITHCLSALTECGFGNVRRAVEADLWTLFPNIQKEDRH